MKLSISNIAWNNNNNHEVINLLRKYNFDGVEVAPLMVWNDISSLKRSEIKEYRDYWNDNGFSIVAMQGILFGKPNLTIFDSSETRKKTFEYICRIIDISEELESKKIVFGSPKNRITPEKMPETEVNEIATEFFTAIGNYCKSKEIYFCIEANPKVYGANFITNNTEALDLVKKINHPNFQLHLDTGIMVLNNENYEETIAKCLPFTKHTHISEPNLDPIGSHHVDHDKIAKILKEKNYSEWGSIEMKLINDSSWLEKFEHSLKVVKQLYG